MQQPHPPRGMPAQGNLMYMGQPAGAAAFHGVHGKNDMGYDNDLDDGLSTMRRKMKATSRLEAEDQGASSNEEMNKSDTLTIEKLDCLVKEAREGTSAKGTSLVFSPNIDEL